MSELNPPETIFDGARLRATLFDAPKSFKPVIVRMQHRITDLNGFEPARIIKGFHAQGHPILNIQSSRNDWYINSETKDLEDALSQFMATRPGSRIIGFSMGGYGALRFAMALKAQSLVLVSPQYSIHPKVVPFEKRYHADAEDFDPDVGDLRKLAMPALPGLIFYDPFIRRDRRHVDLIQGHFTTLKAFRLPGGGHPASKLLGDHQQAKMIMAAALTAQPSGKIIHKTHRALRGETERYWRRLALYAGKRFPELKDIPALLAGKT